LGPGTAAARHTVTLLHPSDVARYRDSNTTDRADAKALLEAVRNAALEAKAEALRTELAALAKQMPAAQLLRTVPAWARSRPPRWPASSATSTGSAPPGTLPPIQASRRASTPPVSVARCPDDLRQWARAVERRQGHNVAAVALANRLARVCWRVWRDQRPFQRREAR
jgi:hypothetical protein